MEGLRGGLLPEPLIDAVQQFLSFAVFVTQRIFRVGFHGASLPDAVSERKGGQRRFVNVLLQGVEEFPAVSCCYKFTVDWTTFDCYFRRLEKQGTPLNIGTYVGAGR